MCYTFTPHKGKGTFEINICIYGHSKNECEVCLTFFQALQAYESKCLWSCGLLSSRIKKIIIIMKKIAKSLSVLRSHTA